jgi:hypothetical protein
MFEIIETLVSITIAAVPLAAGWYTWRKKELRRDDVLAWSNEVIGSLQTLLLITILKHPPLSEQDAQQKLAAIIFETSILVERGRLFFRNEIADSHGSKKLPAYQGYRPEILDQIVIAHQISCEWTNASADDRLRMRSIAETCLKKFVSLAQKEVGRGRTASADTSKGEMVSTSSIYLAKSIQIN